MFPDRDKLLAPGLLLAVLIAFFLPILASGRLIAPGDGIAQNFPLRVVVAEAIRRGEMPFWNPYNFSGTPLFATLQPGVLFPANWTFWFLPPVAAMHLSLLMAYAIAGVAAYALARALRLGRLPALISGFAYMLSGYLLLNAQHLMIVQVAALLPLLLWAIERFRSTGRSAYAAAGAVVLVLQVFAGHPQTMVYGALLGLAYAAFRGVGLPRGRHGGYLAQVLLLFGLGGGLALVQLLPAIDFIRDSQRQAISYAQLVYNTPTLHGMPGLLFPGFLGSRSPTPLLPHPLWPPDTWRWWLQGYVGLGTLLFSLMALGRGPRRGQALFWAAVAGLALVLAMGGNTPIYRIWAWFPVVNQMPYPHRHLLEFTLALAMLAGLGTARLLEGGAAVRRALLAAAGLLGAVMLAFGAALGLLGPAFAKRTQPLLPPGIDLAAALHPGQPAFWMPLLLLAGLSFLAWNASSRAARVGLLALLVLDLGLAGYHNGYWQLCPSPPSLTPHHEEGRSLSVSKDYYPYYRPMPFLEALAQPSLSDAVGVRNIHGYDAFIFKRYARLMRMNSAGQLADPAIWSPGHHGLAILGLRHLRLEAALESEASWGERLNSPDWRRLGEKDGVATYAYARGLPRAWRVTSVRTLAPDAVDRQVREAAAFDPRAEALVETVLAPQDWSPGPASMIPHGLNRIHLHSSGPGPGFVVVSESYDRGWRAFEGDRELPVYRADGLVMGIAVPAGEVAVELRYEPPMWRAGLAGSGLALIGLIAWLRWGRRRGWQQGDATWWPDR